MADVTYIYENLLPERTPVAVNDFIRVIGSDNASYKALVSNLAKCIVENYAGSSLAGADTTIQNAINEINTKVDLADGGLAIATSASAMTNHDLIYVYTGSETGYTYGDWYFWNGSAWASGGEVGSIVPDASLSQEGRAADAKVTGDILAEKADKDGVIATAEGLIGGAYTIEKEPYHFRKTAVDLAGRLDETIVGGSLAWNQLSDDYLSTTMNGVDVSYNNGVVTFNGTNTGSEVRFTNWTRKVIENHVYLCTGVGLPNGSYIRYASGTINGNVYSDAYHATVFKGQISVSNTAVYVARASAGYEYTNVKFISHVIDLTTTFGSTIADYIYSLEQATAGAGVAWVKRYIDLDTYHEYDAGSIQSVEGLESHNTYDEDENLLASYPLDSSVTLRGVPKLVTDHIEFDGDKYKSDGTVERRYGVVDLGTLTYVKSSSITNGFVAISGVPDDFPLAPSTLAIPNWLCLGYQIMSNVGIEGSSVDEAMAWRVSGSNKGIIIRDSVYAAYYSDNDMDSFKTAMSGVMLVYELATPTTETAQPFQSPMIVGATEEYVSGSVVPVGHESKYYEDVAKKVSGLPKDFSTLIAPVEVTFTATRNYSVGNYLIVKNQLYKVTSAISTGGTITPNSNVTATTIMAEILALA